MAAGSYSNTTKIKYNHTAWEKVIEILDKDIEKIPIALEKRA